MFEALEGRALMSVTLHGGLLIVEGSGDDDNVRLIDRDGQLVVTENGVESAYPSGKVGRILVNGGAGNDLIDASEATVKRLELQITGGDGNDTLVAAPGRSHIRGGDGRDTLTGTGRGDYLDGRSGRDSLRAGAGGGFLVGGRGLDILSGGAGPDTIYTGRGEGARKADGAADIATGGGGEDYLIYDDVSDTHGEMDKVEFFLLTANPPTKVAFRASSEAGVVAVISTRFGSTAWFLKFGEPMLDGNTIRLQMLAYRPNGGVFPAMTTERRKIDLGKLSGSYTIEIVGHGGEVLVKQAFYADRSGVRDSDAMWFRT